MTAHKQQNVVKFFRRGEHKVLVSTSVLEEGYDVSECDRVIRYNYVGNMTSHIQTKGYI